MKTTCIPILFCILILISCRKDSFITSPDARVSISADTLKYDTVFVTAGSTYRAFTIRNENDQKLLLSSVQLMGGAGSSFKMNVDGVPGVSFSNIEIEANDSLYVFVQVNVDPSSGQLPLIIRDSIQVSYNGKDRLVQLEAWGQNAHFFRDRLITANEIWNNDLPYVILGSLQVGAGNTLTINPGCRIYVHSNAPIIIDGTLKVNGASDTADRVYFTGDRLDEPYNQYPASWPGIYFRPGSRDNELSYAVIRNAYQAIAVEDPSPNANPKLILNECVIDNAYGEGILGINTSIWARNCLVSNCGQNLLLVKGGDYRFEHCTIVTYANRFIDHKKPVLLLTNFIIVNNNTVAMDLAATFTNCIFWGENGLVNDEVEVLKSGTTLFNVTFDHNLWKVQNIPANINPPLGMINNQPPLFDSIHSSDNYYDFRLQPASPAINTGKPSGVTGDLSGNPRPVGLPDLGCFEKQ